MEILGHRLTIRELLSLGSFGGGVFLDKGPNVSSSFFFLFSFTVWTIPCDVNSKY